MQTIFVVVLWIIVAFTTSCKKEDDTACYHFTVKSVTDIIPDNDSTYPRTNYDEFDECEIDEEEARQIQSSFTLSNNDTLQGILFLNELSCTYYKK